MVKEKIEKYKKPLKIYGLTIFYGIILGSIGFFVELETIHYQIIFVQAMLLSAGGVIAMPLYWLSIKFGLEKPYILKTLSSFLIGITSTIIDYFMVMHDLGGDNYCAFDEPDFGITLWESCGLKISVIYEALTIGVILGFILTIIHSIVWLIAKAYKDKPWLK